MKWLIEQSIIKKRKRRDEDARRSYMLELENETEDGIFIRDLMKEGV